MSEHSDWGRSVTMKLRVVLVCLVALVTIWLSGCGHYTCGATFGNSSCSASGGGTGNTGGTGTSGGDYVYVGDPGGIQSILFNASAGTLTASSSVTNIPATLIPSSMVIAAEKYMYVAYPTAGDIYAWALAGDGTMSAINSGTPYSAAYMVTNSVGTQSFIVNPAGTVLYSVDQSIPEVHIYAIGSGGALTESTPLTLPSGFSPYNLAMDGLGKYLYISNLSSGVTNQIAAYAIGSGTPTAVTGSPFSLSVVQMQGEPEGEFMVGTASTFSVSDSHIYLLSITNGALAVVGTPLATTYPPSSVTVQPANGGSLVYSFTTDSGGGGGLVEGFSLNISSGTLTENASSPFNVTGDSGQFEQTGAYLYVRDQLNKDLSVYTVSTGSSTLSNPTATVGWQTGEWAWAPSDVQ